MILSLNAPSGSTMSLDFAKPFGARVELEGFQFITPPTDFRLVRGNKPLQEWQQGNSEIYDLQHCPGMKSWARDAHCFTNDFDHRRDVMTCADVRCVKGTHIALDQGDTFGPFVAGSDGVELFEVMMGDPRSFAADSESYERFLAERDVRQLPNPPIDMPNWLEDTRSGP